MSPHPASTTNVLQFPFALVQQAEATGFSSALSDLFRGVYFHLYSNSNMPRAERLSGEIVRLIFCKLFDEDQPLELLGSSDLDDDEAFARLNAVFEQVKRTYPEVFPSSEAILLDPKSCSTVINLLAPIRLRALDEDVLGSLFQAFLGPRLRGEQGQFFTPSSLVQMMVDLSDLPPGCRVLDPACGTGGFLAGVHRFEPSAQLVGIDKEYDLARITKAYFMILGQSGANIFNCDSLDESSWSSDAQAMMKPGSFDLVLTNPPFGTKVAVTDPRVLKRFQLGHRWVRGNLGWRPSPKVLDHQDPQVLFVELCLDMLKEDGQLGIVLPEGLLGNSASGNLLDFIRSRGRIEAVIDCPRTVFQPSTDTKTNVLFVRKGANETSRVFMGVVTDCGHDRRGRPTGSDEFPLVGGRFRDKASNCRLGFWTDPSELDPYYLIPRSYDPALLSDPANADTELITLSELEESGVVSILKPPDVTNGEPSQDEAPFIRTSDIANWEISGETTRRVSAKALADFRKRFPLSATDILVVNDGRYRIGNCCMLTRHDLECVVQSHFRVLRVEQPNSLNPYLLLYLLSTPFVRRQIKAKVMVQSTIGTLGSRLRQVVLPLPKNPEERQRIADSVEEVVEGRARLLALAKGLGMDSQPDEDTSIPE